MGGEEGPGRGVKRWRQGAFGGLTAVAKHVHCLSFQDAREKFLPEVDLRRAKIGRAKASELFAAAPFDFAVPVCACFALL